MRGQYWVRGATSGLAWREPGRPGGWRPAATTARVVAVCGLPGGPSCEDTPNPGYNVTWFRHGVFYQLLAQHESLRTVIGFARGLHYVN